MNLELKGGGKFGVDDEQDKVNRNFKKEEGHNKEKNPSKQNEIKLNSLPSVRNMIVHWSRQYRNQKPGNYTNWNRSCIRTENHSKHSCKTLEQLCSAIEQDYPDRILQTAQVN